MTWERFRELFEDGVRRRHAARTPGGTTTPPSTCSSASATRSACGRSPSGPSRRSSPGCARSRPRNGGEGMMPSTIKVRLQFLHTALRWAVDQKMLPAVPAVPRGQGAEEGAAAGRRRGVREAAGQGAATTTCGRSSCAAGWPACASPRPCELEWEETDEAPYLDLARDRIVLPAEFVKAVEDQWVPLDPELREVLEALPRHGAKVFRFVASKGGEPTDRRRACPSASATWRTRPGVKLTMKTLRRGFGCRYAGKVSGAGAPEAHAAREHQDHDGLLRQRGRRGRGGRPGAPT